MLEIDLKLGFVFLPNKFISARTTRMRVPFSYIYSLFSWMLLMEHSKLEFKSSADKDHFCFSCGVS
jgi:hypothetical protein